MPNRLDFTTPLGRYVSGDLMTKRSKDSDGRSIPEDKQQFEYGIAFPKAEIWPLLSERWFPFLQTELARDQNGLTRATNWFSTLSGFSMKVGDGDKPNSKGKLNENTQGCFVLYFSSLYQPKTYGPAPTYVEIDPTTFKRGFYGIVSGNITPNGLSGDHAGVYLNGDMLSLCYEGDVITGGRDPNDAFAGAAVPPAPPGARALGATSGFTAPGQPQTVSAPQAVGLPGVPPQTASAPVVPHTAILAGPPKLPGM